MGDAGSPQGVVAQQQQSLAGLVQPPDRTEPGQPGGGKRIVNGGAAMLVRRADHQAARLVEHHVEQLRSAERLTVDSDASLPCAHGMLRIAHHLSIEGDPARADPPFGLAAGTDALFR